MHVPGHVFETNSISTLRRYIIYSMVVRVSPSGQIKNIYMSTPNGQINIIKLTIIIVQEKYYTKANI